jgi:hypothetical protein
MSAESKAYNIRRRRFRVDKAGYCFFFAFGRV